MYPECVAFLRKTMRVREIVILVNLYHSHGFVQKGNKFMTFYLILKNWKYVKRQVDTQNKQKLIVHSKNIIINKFVTYFYAEKFSFINFPMISIHFFRPTPTFLTIYLLPSKNMACDVNLVITMVFEM